MLKLGVDLWNSSLEISTKIMHASSGQYKDLAMVFDTGAYMTTIHDKILLKAGYDLKNATDDEITVVGGDRIHVKKLLLKGFGFTDIYGTFTTTT